MVSQGAKGKTPISVIGMRVKFGFTLVEILVVLIIIGTTMTFAMLSFGDFGKSRQSKAAAEQFIEYVTLLEQKAILENKLLGISIKPHAYQAMKYNSSHGWQTISNGSLYTQQPLPKGLHFNQGKRDMNAKVDIIIQTTGDITPFSISISNNDKKKAVRILGKANGEVIISDSI